MTPEFASAIEAAEQNRLFAVAEDGQYFVSQIVDRGTVGNPEEAPPTGEFVVCLLAHQ
jgi:hypothetical protein